MYGSEYIQQSIDSSGNTVLNKNQIDSFVEYVMEEMLVHKNVFPEHKGNHTKNTNKLIKAPYQVFVPHSTQEAKYTIYTSNKNYSLYRSPFYSLYYAEIYPEPPNVA